MLFIPIMQIIAGLALLVGGGELLVRGAVALAKNYGVPTLFIALTVVAYGTSAPEIIVSVNAGITGAPAIAIGNVVGSNIINILLVLGLAAFLYPVTVDKRLIKFDGMVMGIFALVLFLFLMDDYIYWWHGALLLAGFGYYNYLLVKEAKKSSASLLKHQKEEVQELTRLSIATPKAAMFCTGGIILLAFGADILVGGAVIVAEHIGVSQAMIGLTIVAIGTSLPELVSSIVAARHKHSDVVIGNIIGSNIVNVGCGIGLASLFAPLEVAQRFALFDGWFMLVITICLIIIMVAYKTVSRQVGIAGLALFLLYMAIQVILQ